MARRLIITEKPSVARDVVAALPGSFARKGEHWESDDTIVAHSVGHLVEQLDPDGYDARYRRWAFEDLPIIPERFVYEARDDRAAKLLKGLHALMRRKDVDVIVNACDAGREGELIFKTILQTSGVEKPVRRAWFSSMTKAAVRAAFEQLRDDDEMQPLEAAARARSEADWLVGMNATRAATTRTASMRNIVSLGRVQTPTLALIARRDEEIAAFVPEDYWQVRAAFATGAAATYTGLWAQGSRNRIPSAEEAERVRAAVDGRPGRVASVEKKPVVEQPPLLYDLTSLQRDANQRFGFTARRTLDAAQRCYEQHKVLTYPRTNSRYLTTDLTSSLRSVAGHVGASDPALRAGADYVRGLDVLPLGRVVDDARVGDHHAIIPTDERHDIGALGPDERRIYDLVARRFLAVFHPPARSEQTTVWTEVEAERFRSSGRVLLDAGWRAVYGEVAEADRRRGDDDEAEQTLPPLAEGEAVATTAVEVLAKQTKPPAHFTESTLLRAMETAGRLVVDDDEAADAMKDSGIGTPATRAAIIDGLIDRAYVEREGKALRATPKGLGVIRMLGDHDLTKVDLTGSWEKRLRAVERGNETRDAFMQDIRDFTERTVQWFADKDRTALKIERRVIGPCPRCDGQILELPKSYGCSSWRSKSEPGCGFVIWKRQGGRTISPEEAEVLVAEGRSSEDLQPERVVLGPCPTPDCGGEIIERTKSYGCTSWKSRSETGCGYVIWKRAKGRDVPLEEAIEMVRRGETNAAPATPAEPLGPCPTAGCSGEIIERRLNYGCTSWKSKKQPGCGYAIWKRPRGLGREIGREEAVDLVRRGLTAPPAEDAAGDAAA